MRNSRMEKLPESTRREVLDRTVVATLSKLEYESLRVKFPETSDLFPIRPKHSGSKVEIPLTENFRNRAPEKLLDHLYLLAHQINEEKFFSYYNQVQEVVKLPKSRVDSILEIGVKGGIFNSLMRNYNYPVTTFDIDPAVNPDIIGNVLDIQLENNAFDMAVCFEILEHLPYTQFKTALYELSRVAKNYVFLSLPYHCSSFYIEFRLRLVQRFIHRLSGSFTLYSYWPSLEKDIDDKDFSKRKDSHNPHYWELGRKGYPKQRVLADIESSGLRIVKKFHSSRKPYHFFIMCEKR